MWLLLLLCVLCLTKILLGTVISCVRVCIRTSNIYIYIHIYRMCEINRRTLCTETILRRSACKKRTLHPQSTPTSPSTHSSMFAVIMQCNVYHIVRQNIYMNICMYYVINIFVIIVCAFDIKHCEPNHLREMIRNVLVKLAQHNYGEQVLDAYLLCVCVDAFVCKE